MISFRYHVVSIVAVFLALGLGVLAGTTVVNRGLVHNLKTRTAQAERERDALNKQLQVIRLFEDASVPLLLHGKLAHRQVILVSDASADGAAVTEARDAMTEAGANVVADLQVTDHMGAATPGTVSELGGVLGVASSSPRELSREAGFELADRLANGLPREPKPGGQQTDLLNELLLRDFLLPRPHQSIPRDLTAVGGSGQSVVVMAGGQGDPAVPFRSFLVPFVEELVNEAMPVAAGEPAETSHPFVGLLRADAALRGPRDVPLVVTVDDFDPGTRYGSVALVLGMHDLLRSGQGGDYGTKGGSSGPLPQAP